MNFLRRLSFSIWYYFRPPWDTGISPPELVGFLDAHPPGRALDMGCGTGTNIITMAKRGWQVTGIDFAPTAIKIARRKARGAGVKVDLNVGDVWNIDGLTGRFDLILDIGCLHGLSDGEQTRTMEAVVSLLAPQGTYLLYCMLRDSDEGPRPGLSPSDLQRLAENFSLVRREDGLNRGTRPAAWLTYAHKAD